MPSPTRMLITRAATVALTVAAGFLYGWNGHSMTTGVTLAAATGGAALAAIFGSNGRDRRSAFRPGRRHQEAAPPSDRTGHVYCPLLPVSN
jgi:hypothetical protein